MRKVSQSNFRSSRQVGCTQTGGFVNLAEMIDGHAGDSVAIIGRNRATTYAELADLVGRARGGFRAEGIAAGDRVVIVCSNGVPFVVAYLALLGIGAVAVPLNPTSPAGELAREIETVGAIGAVVDRSRVGRLAGPRRCRRFRRFAR